MIVDENSNPFELGCASEVFGLDRPEMGRTLYDFRLCSPDPSTRMRDGFFTLTGVADLDAADDADTLIVPNRPDVEVPRAAKCWLPSDAHTTRCAAGRLLQRRVHPRRGRSARRPPSHRALAVGGRLPGPLPRPSPRVGRAVRRRR